MQTTHSSPGHDDWIGDLALSARRHWMLLLVCALAGVTVAAAAGAYWMNEFRAVARVRLSFDRPVVDVFNQEHDGEPDLLRLQTQADLLSSRNVLLPVVQRLDLERRWADLGDGRPEYALRRLESILSLRRRMDSAVMEITLRDRDPELAAQVVNAIGDAYVAIKENQHQQRRRDAVENIHRQADQQWQRVIAIQQQVEKLRQESGLALLGSAMPDENVIASMQSQLVQAQIERMGQEARVLALRQLAPRHLYGVVAALVEDRTYEQLQQRLAAAEVALSILQSRYGDDHPALAAAYVQRQRLRRQVDDCLEGMIRSFETQRQMAQSKAAALSDQLDRARQSAVELASQRYLPFRNAQREAELELRLYETMRTRLGQEEITLQMPRNATEMIDRASSHLSPVGPPMRVMTAGGGLVGLLAGLLLAMAFERRDLSLRNWGEVESVLHLPLLGVVGRSRRGGSSRSADLEAHRMVRNRIQFGAAPIRSLCITSATASQGTSHTTAHLARAFAEQGLRVLVVDMNFANPTMHRLTGAGNDLGARHVLGGNVPLEQAAQLTHQANLWVLAAGQGDGPVSLRPASLHRLAFEAAAGFDIVLYDTPPLLHQSDSAMIAREVGNSLLVVGHRRQSRTIAMRGRQLLGDAGSHILGVVLTDVSRLEMRALYAHAPQGADRRMSQPTMQIDATAQTYRGLAA